MANFIEYSNGEADTITDPKSASGIKNRFKKAVEEGEFAPLKDVSGDRLYVNPAQVTRIYSDGVEDDDE